MRWRSHFQAEAETSELVLDPELENGKAGLEPRRSSRHPKRLVVKFLLSRPPFCLIHHI